MLTGKESDLTFDSPKCKNCTAKAVSEFTVEYDESVAYFGSDQECIGVLGTLRFDENLGGQINVEVEPLKDVPWQYRDYQSVFNVQYSDELPPHRSFDVTPNEALPYIGRQPRRNAKDDRCNLPALL